MAPGLGPLRKVGEKKHELAVGIEVCAANLRHERLQGEESVLKPALVTSLSCRREFHLRLCIECRLTRGDERRLWCNGAVVSAAGGDQQDQTKKQCRSGIRPVA